MSYAILRAKRIIEARKIGPTAATTIEQAVASELLHPETINRDKATRPTTYPQHGYLSPFAATEAFGVELQRGLTHLASNIDVKAPKPGKYNPLVTTPTLFREIWYARQVVDELGIPYWFYVEYAVLRWYELGNKRMPRPSQLTIPDIVMHVMEYWADPAFRWNYPLLANWDERFNIENYAGELMQDRALELIEQRVADARALGHNPAAELVKYLDFHITEDEAVRRFGDDLVYEAMELEAVAVAEALSSSTADGDTELVKVIEGL